MLAEVQQWWHQIDATGNLTVTFMDGTRKQFRVEETDRGMWPLIDYTAQGLLVRYYNAASAFIPWPQIMLVNFEPEQ